jgi:hypothetical protein
VLPESCQACVFGNTMSKGKAFYFGPASLPNSKACMIEYRLRNYSSLRENLSGVYECCASDPRDLIYACLGYSSSSYDIEPDYKSETSFCDVCCQLASSATTISMHFRWLSTICPLEKTLNFPHGSQIGGGGLVSGRASPTMSYNVDNMCLSTPTSKVELVEFYTHEGFFLALRTHSFLPLSATDSEVRPI